MPRMAGPRGTRSSQEASEDTQARNRAEKGLEVPQVLEFVTVIGSSYANRDETSKKIRTQVMRDYIRKQNRQAVTGTIEVVGSAVPENPSQYKGRFKLNTWSHKTRTKALNRRRSLEVRAGGNKAAISVEPAKVTESANKTQISPYKKPKPVSFLEYRRLDPFDSFPIRLGPRSERLLVHYHGSYSMNSVAINPEGDFFSLAKADPAVLHSILYLVALHHDLKLGQSDSPESLYHGSEAFRIINSRLQEGVFSDLTIAAVAMLVTKENLNGKYDVSKIHMHGLEYMIRARGGIHKLKGVFQRITSWSDFCFANVWGCQPRFSHLPLPSVSTPSWTSDPEPNDLPPEGLFGTQSPIIPIFHSLRILSHELDLAHFPTLSRLDLSSMIYGVEFGLLKLNKDNPEDFEPTSCVYSFEAIPLKTAAHLYLYLAVREIPPTSQLLFRLVERLHDALELQEGGWWDSTDERRMWLLWMLFMGGAVAAGRFERWWFVKEMSSVCSKIGILEESSLRDALKRVLWQEAWCSDHCVSLWNDIKGLEDS